MTASMATDSGLNPSYLRARGLVALPRDGDIARFGAARELDEEERRALEFALGGKVEIVRLSEEEVADNLVGNDTEMAPRRHAAMPSTDTTSDAAPGAMPVPDALAAQLATGPQTQSLADIWASKVAPSPVAAMPWARLLDAGYTPHEAGVMLAGAGHMPAPPAAESLCHALLRGDTFGDAVAEDAALPVWLKSVVDASHDEAAQIGSFVAVAQFDAAMARVGRRVFRRASKARPCGSRRSSRLS